MTSEDILSMIALYTPVVQVVSLYAYYYRGEPPRILHPLREKTALRAWIDVLTQLGLIKERLETNENGKREMAGSVIKLLMPTALLSLLSTDLLAPLLFEMFPLLARFESVLFFFIQFIPAAYFFIIAQRDYLGPTPLEPLRHILPPKHRSSLIRHLEEL